MSNRTLKFDERLSMMEHAPMPDPDIIVSDPAVMCGMPVVRGTRLPASMLHARVTGGDTIESILEDYPYLDRDMIRAAVLFTERHPERKAEVPLDDDVEDGKSLKKAG